MPRFRFVSCFIFLIAGAAIAAASVVVSDMPTAHRPLTLTIKGPAADEAGQMSPFADCLMVVIFEQGDTQIDVPAYFAADGDAANTGATSGNVWRAHFVPPSPGDWNFRVAWAQEKDIVSSDAAIGLDTQLDGVVSVAKHDERGDDTWARGKVQYVGERYLRYSASGKWFLKAGADSPENLLAYVDFDDTYKNPAANERAKRTQLHRYEPHIRDWREGDPTWRGGKGKGLIGALNYLASKGMNSVYFLTMNVTGDGDDVWPWIDPDTRDRFDCSKLDQWNIVFDHMDRLGIGLHVVLQETENDHLLNDGTLGRERKLYFREMVARFAHHQNVTWNLGEENVNSHDDIRAFSQYIKVIDPYENPIVLHTYPNQKEKRYAPLVGEPTLDGLSLQFNDDWADMPGIVRDWVERAAKAGRPWVVNVDEPGNAGLGVDPDAKPNNNQHLARKHALWGALMAGGGGVEWYFGYKNPHNDLNLEDWRSRDQLWEQTTHAIRFFEQHLPFTEMASANESVSGPKNYCFAKPGEIYTVYLVETKQPAELNLRGATGTFDVHWYNPRTGGPLQKGDIHAIDGGGRRGLGNPPQDLGDDWVILVRQR